MAASPVNGDRPLPALRRSTSNIVTAPPRSFSYPERAVLSQEDAGADILYTHPSVRIYHFQPPTDALATLDKSKKTLPDADYPIDAIEILPWRSRTETLSAKGKLIVEKVQGSVHFLKCGSVIHTIMRNSQCWCVDGESKFVMRIGRLRYQRIEMPATEPQDREKVQEFKEVIGRILKFEKTPCPFIRAFHVDLPEDAITPRRRGTWKRRESSTPTIAEDEPSFTRKLKPSRTMSMKAPPTSFPVRSMTQMNMERPRTASTPSSHGRFSFPEIRSDSPATYTSGEEGTDSDRPDSASEHADSSHNSEVEESDRDTNAVPSAKSPLKNVEIMSPIADKTSFLETPDPRFKLPQRRDNRPLVATHVQTFNEYSIHARDSQLAERGASLPGNEVTEPRSLPRSTFANPAKVQETKGKTEDRLEKQRQDQPTIFARVESTQLDYSEDHSSQRPLQPQVSGTHTDGRLSEHPLQPQTSANYSDGHSLEHALQSLGSATREGRPSGHPLEPQITAHHTEVYSPEHPERPKMLAEEEEARKEAVTSNHEMCVEDDTQEQDTTDTDSLYERLKAEVQREVEVVEADRRRSNALLAFTQDSTEVAAGQHLGNLPAEPFEADSNDASETQEQGQVEKLLRTQSNDDSVSNISTDSFHTMLSDEDLHLTSPRGTVGKRPFSHRRDVSEVTVTTDSINDVHIDGIEEDDEEGTIMPVTPVRQLSVDDEDDESMWPRRRTPGAFEDDTEIRQRLRHRRSLSQIPASSSTINSSLRSPTGDGIPAALIQKAANLALVKPLEAVILLVHVCSRIAQGATVNDLLSGELFRRPGVRRTASGSFDQNIQGRRTMGGSEDEDDFAMPLRRRNSLSQQRPPSNSLKKQDDDAASFASID